MLLILLAVFLVIAFAVIDHRIYSCYKELQQIRKVLESKPPQ